MKYLIILLLNMLVYRKAIYYNLINDDSAVMKTNPFNVKREKQVCIFLHTIIAEYVCFIFGIVGFIAAILISVHPHGIQIPIWRSAKDYGKNALMVLMSIAYAPIGSIFYIFANHEIPCILFTPFIFLFTKHWYLVFIFPIIALFTWKKLKWAIDNRAERHKVFSAQDDCKIGKFKWTNLVIVVKTFSYYALASLLPIKNGYYNSFLVTIGSSEKETKYWLSLNRHFWGGLFAMILMGIAWWFNKFNYIGLGIMLFVTSIGPYLNFITVQQWTTSRYAYTALIGFQIALVGILIQFGTPGYCIISALFLYYLDRNFKVQKVYAKDNITAIILDSEEFPENPRLWYYRYEHWLHKHNPIMAWAEASYGLKHLPEDCQLWFGLACACFELGDMNAASEFLKTSERFMILCERKNMESLIVEFKARIKAKLLEKYSPERRF